MQKFLDNRMGTLITILVLAVGSISIMTTTHVAKADQNGNQCVFFSCANTTITGGTSGGGGGGQTTPTTGTLTVIKVVDCTDLPVGTTCPPASTFKITVSQPNASPQTFDGSASGTKVTLDPGFYEVSETVGGAFPFKSSFSGNCLAKSPGSETASGTMVAGDSQECTITNKVLVP